MVYDVQRKLVNLPNQEISGLAQNSGSINTSSFTLPLLSHMFAYLT